MRALVSALVTNDAGRRLKSVEIGVIERSADLAPAFGLGLFLGESHELLRQLQALMLKTQVEQFLQAASRCASCGAHRAVKDAKTCARPGARPMGLRRKRLTDLGMNYKTFT